MPEPSDLTRASAHPFVRRVDKPWGWELHFVPEDWPYMVKILHINAGARLSLQRHLPGPTSPAKVETLAPALWAGESELGKQRRAVRRNRARAGPRV